MPAGAQRRTAPTAQSHTNTDTHAVFETPYQHESHRDPEIQVLLHLPVGYFCYIIIMLLLLLLLLLCYILVQAQLVSLHRKNTYKGGKLKHLNCKDFDRDQC